MVSPVESSTVNLVKLALDASSMRQQALANNIANLNTPGYVPYRVSFEDQLAGARAKYLSGQPVSESDLAGVAPALVEDTAAVGATKVSVDTEVANLAQNVVHYQALVRGLSKKMALLSMIINEGRR